MKTWRNRIPIAAGLTILFGLLLSGCNLPSTTPATPTFVFPTLTTAPTPVPTTVYTQLPAALPPTSTPNVPTPTTKSAAVRIEFSPGATAGIEQGTLQPGEFQDFVLEAGQSQPMIVMADSPAHDVTLGIVGRSSGSTLLEASKKWSSWEGILPATQDYMLTVYAGTKTEDFTLTVTIPSRITFSQGATSTTVSGSTPSGLVVSYVLYALANQTLSVSLNVPADSAALTIYGFEDGQPLLRSALNATTWSSELPVTEDYIVQVVPKTGQVVNYTMTIAVK
jgi:hypothetical protein